MPTRAPAPGFTRRSRVSAATILVLALAVILLAALSGPDHRDLAQHLLRALVSHRF